MDEEDLCFVNVVAKVLERLIDANDWRSMPSHVVTKFQSSYVPDVSILSYLERIQKYAKCSNCVFVAALIYIDRIIDLQQLILSKLNIHRLLISSVLVAAKFLDDFFYNNAYYARLGGISLCEMNSLELEFLQLIHFSLHITADNYNYYRKELTAFTMIPLHLSVHGATNIPIDQPQKQEAFVKGSNASSKIHVYHTASSQKVKVSRVDCLGDQMEYGISRYHRVEEFNSSIASVPCQQSTFPATLGIRRIVSDSDWSCAGQLNILSAPMVRVCEQPVSLENESNVVFENLGSMRNILGVTRTASTVTPPLDDDCGFTVRRSISPDTFEARAIHQAPVSHSFSRNENEHVANVHPWHGDFGIHSVKSKDCVMSHRQTKQLLHPRPVENAHLLRFVPHFIPPDPLCVFHASLAFPASQP